MAPAETDGTTGCVYLEKEKQRGWNSNLLKINWKKKKEKHLWWEKDLMANKLKKKTFSS